MKRLFILIVIVLCGTTAFTQNLANMSWYNKPAKACIKDGVLNITVEPATDYWRITHYGFIRDNGPFHYTEQSGSVEASVKITGAYR